MNLTLDMPEHGSTSLVNQFDSFSSIEGTTIPAYKLSVVNRVKSLALEGISPQEIINVVAIKLADVEHILSETLNAQQVGLLGIPRLTSEFEAYTTYVSKLEEIDKITDDQEKGYALKELYSSYTTDSGAIILPQPITYADINEYKSATKTTIVESSDAMLSSLRRKLIGNLLQEANNDLITRRDAISILRVVGTGDKDNKNASKLTNITQNTQNNNNFTINYDPDKIKGEAQLVLSEDNQVLGINGNTTGEISRSDLMEMLANLTD